MKEYADKKKVEEDAVKKAKEDADRKSEADAAAKKAEAKRQDDLTKHLTQPLFRLTQAGVQLMKDNPDLGKNGKVIYIPGLYYETKVPKPVPRSATAERAGTPVSFTWAHKAV